MTDRSTSAPPRFASRASLVLLVVALPVFLFTAAPLAGWVVAAFLWTFSTMLHVGTRYLSQHSGTNAAMGMAAGAMFLRMGVVIMTLLFVGVSADVDGTQFGLGEPDVALVALILYTLVFTFDIGERIAVDVSTHRSSTVSAEEQA